jgi:hypothetical protein
MNGVVKKLKYAADRADVIQYIRYYPLRQVVFYIKQSIAIMKCISKWWSDTTFNM